MEKVRLAQTNSHTYDWDFVIIKRYHDKDWFKEGEEEEDEEDEEENVVLLRAHLSVYIWLHHMCVHVYECIEFEAKRRIHFKKAHYLCVNTAILRRREKL